MGDRIDKILKDSLKEQHIPKELPDRILKTINDNCFKEDKVDKILKDSLKEQSTIPDELPNRILKTINENCFNETKKNKHKNNILYKFATGICACILITTTAVFAGELISSIFNLSEEQYSQKQLQKAIKEKYIQANNSGEYIKSDSGILYKFNNVLLNDINLILSLEFIFEDNLNDYQGITFTELKVTDENNNQIYTSNANSEVWLKSVSPFMQTITVEKRQNKIEETLLFIGHNFPKSEKLYLSFDSIILYNVENGVPTIKTINGNYNIEIPIDSKFNNREVIEYEIKNEAKYEISGRSEHEDYGISIYEISIEEVRLTNTGLGIVFNGPWVSGRGYTCKIYEENGREIYSITNSVDNIETLERYFMWVDVNDDFKENKNFKLELIDMEGNTYLFDISQK